MTRRAISILGGCLIVCTSGIYFLSPNVSRVAAQQMMMSARPVACSAQKPVAWQGDKVLLEAWAILPNDQPANFVWSSASGRLEAPTGQTTVWDSRDVPIGSHDFMVRISAPDGNVTDCTVQVILRERQQTMGTGRPSYSSFLLPDGKEGPHYGLYSYLLFGSKPDTASRDRYLKAIEAYLDLLSPLALLESLLRRDLHRLNVVYVPLRQLPASDIQLNAAWVLENYDYDRARILLQAIDVTLLRGPYLFSIAEPLSSLQEVEGKPRILQDLSWVPGSSGAVVRKWTEQFLCQAAQQRFWEERTMQLTVLKLRTTIEVLAVGLPEVRKAWKDEYIAFLKPKDGK